MKKFYSFLFAAVALVGFAACNSDSTEDQPAPAGAEKLSFKANIDTTKTGLELDENNHNKTTWCKGDVVVIENFEFVCGDDLATFTCTQTGCTSLLNKVVEAVYSKNKDGKIDSKAGVHGALLKATGELTAEDASFNFAVQNAFLKFTTTGTVTLKGAGLFSTGDELTITEAGEHYVAINPAEATLSYEIEKKEVTKKFEAQTIYNLGFLATQSEWEISDGNRFLTTETSDLFVVKNVKLTANNFCLHKVGDTDWKAGAKYGLVEDSGTKAENTAIGLYSAEWSNDITISNAKDTAHDIYFDKANSRLYVLTVGKTPAEINSPSNSTSYNIAGTMSSWDNVEEGYKFNFAGDNVWHLVVNFKANDKFKVKKNNNWNTSYGQTNIQKEVGRSLFDTDNDGNALVKNDGTYEIWVIPSHGDTPLYILKK